MKKSPISPQNKTIHTHTHTRDKALEIDVLNRWRNTQMTYSFLFWVFYFSDPKYDVHPDVHHLKERFEAVTLVMLGVFINGLGPNLDLAANDLCWRRQVSMIMAGYFTMICYKLFHFDAKPHAKVIIFRVAKLKIVSCLHFSTNFTPSCVNTT